MVDTKRHARIKSLIDSTNGEIAVAHFIKADGTPRRMVFRTGVKKGVKGVGRTFNPDEKGLVGVYDMQKAKEINANLKDGDEPSEKAFRFINTQTAFAFKIGGELIRIGDVPSGYEI